MAGKGREGKGGGYSRTYTVQQDFLSHAVLLRSIVRAHAGCEWGPACCAACVAVLRCCFWFEQDVVCDASVVQQLVRGCAPDAYVLTQLRLRLVCLYFVTNPKHCAAWTLWCLCVYVYCAAG